MEWIPNDEELEAFDLFAEDLEKEFGEIPTTDWYIPGIDHAVDFTIYRQWSNANGGKKPTPD